MAKEGDVFPGHPETMEHRELVSLRTKNLSLSLSF